MNSFMESLRELGAIKLGLIVGVSLIVLVGLGVLIAGSGDNGNLVSLVDNVDRADGGNIISALESQGIPYRIQNGTIRVPQENVEMLRMTLAQQGLLGSGNLPGYELLDQESNLGRTNFQQQIDARRALEGELGRSIMSMDRVAHARVHIVLPERQIFSRERRDPSASVVIHIQGNRTLATEQVTAIQQLIAAAVPSLSPTRISVIDDRGRVYARGIEDEESAMSALAEQQRLTEERRIEAKVEELVGKVYGQNNVRAKATVEMDHNRETVQERTYDPDTQVVVSTQTVEDNRESTETEGQDPITVAQNLPDADTFTGTGAGRFERENRTEETVNFQNSERNRTLVRDTGELLRQHLAVFVNGRFQRDPQSGKVIFDENSNPIIIRPNQEQIAALQTAIAVAVGINQERGDTLVVMQQDFAPVEFFIDENVNKILGIPEERFYQMVQVLALVIVALLVILIVVRPLIARALEATEAEELTGEAALAPGPAALAGPDMIARLDEEGEMEALEQMIDITQVEGRVRASSLRKIGELIDKHPEEAVGILRTWIFQEA